VGITSKRERAIRGKLSFYSFGLAPNILAPLKPSEKEAVANAEPGAADIRRSIETSINF
jgi:hypothetical protein